MKKNKNQESSKYIETIVPSETEAPKKSSKEDPIEIESMAEMTPSDAHHWSHL